MAYPKYAVSTDVAGEHVDLDLPYLYPGDKSVLSLVHPVVTVQKNYMVNKKTPPRKHKSNAKSLGNMV